LTFAEIAAVEDFAAARRRMPVVAGLRFGSSTIQVHEPRISI
jgi:hypothetical protein